MKWDEFFMRHVYLAASKSKDTSTKIGAALVRDNILISEGYNGICRGVSDYIPERYERPEKYFWFEHAERNAVYNAARNGIVTYNSTLYTNTTPCNDCCRGVIQAGIKRVVFHRQWEDIWKEVKGKQWDLHHIRTERMFNEAGIEIIWFNGILNAETLISGKKYIV